MSEDIQPYINILLTPHVQGIFQDESCRTSLITLTFLLPLFCIFLFKRYQQVVHSNNLETFALLVLLLLLLLFRRSTKSLNSQEERLTTSPRLVTRLHLPRAIVVRLRVRKINVIILTPEAAGLVDI